MNPHKVTEMFEQAMCEYTGAPYAVATTSCTMALLLACRYFSFTQGWAEITIPKRTYVGVPMSIKNARHRVAFSDAGWLGEYQLYPLPVWDCARWLRADMYRPGSMMCLSFHWTKQLAIGQGGMVLLDDSEADAWLRKARFDGRTEGVPANKDHFDMIGQHAYMSPRDAADGLSRLLSLPRDNAPLPNSDYPDLSKFEVFR